MKQKIVIHDNLGKTPKTIVKEVEVRDIEHFEAQLKYRSHTFKPKKVKVHLREPRKLRRIIKYE